LRYKINLSGSVALFVCSLAIQGAESQALPSGPKPKVDCGVLAGKSIPATKIALPTKGATITSAKVEAASGSGADALPQYCDIVGEIASIDPAAPPIHFRVNIAANWNQKAIHIGGNGMDGFIPLIAELSRGTGGSPLGPAFPPDAPFPLAQGYATYGGDSGHGGANPPGRGGQGQGRAGGPPQPPDFRWMANKESMKNFAYESIKKTHDAAIEVIQMMYGRKPRINYFMGESQGGREAMMAATRYPEDYDGVLSSVGLIYFTGVMLSPSYRAHLQYAPGAWLPPAKAKTISTEVLRQCDALDGLEDGVINNYYACDRRVNPTITPDPLAKIRCAGGADTGNDCLSDAQMATLNAFHSPMKWGFPLANGETEWPAEPGGSEGFPPGGGGAGWLLVSPNQPLSTATPPPGAGNPLVAMYGDMGKYNLASHSFEELKPQIQELSALVDVPADWTKFLARGGKLILHSAANDYLTNQRSTMTLYENAAKRHGQAKIDKTVRYYITPNAGHGSAGLSATTSKPLPRYMDLVGYLENWVEKGMPPPDTIPQTLKETMPPYTLIRSRPLCRYPNYARYKGSGDPDKMESYTCAAP